jgi:lipopolysaccharide/colanic/teichoic acid biosynthesis glycosyltransferase
MKNLIGPLIIVMIFLLKSTIKGLITDLEAIHMQNETLLDSIRKHDPNILRLAAKQRIGYYIAKRILDFSIALVMLILLLPLMILIAVLIFVYSPGPVFFVQERVGAKRQFKNQEVYWKKVNFRCIKFRTMKLNADSAIHQAYIKALIENNEEQMAALQSQPTQVRKLVKDARIIRPGHFLRKLSLDELPQLWNVLRGEMSLVGPRPAIPYEVEIYKPWHLQRLEAQPGITGLQQITARCTADFDQQVKLDIEYVEKQSFFLDLMIILKTPLVVFSTKGAY